MIMNGSYNADFQKLILESDAMKELKEYQQSYIGHSNITHQYEIKHTEHIHVPFQQILMHLVCGIIMPNLGKE